MRISSTLEIIPPHTHKKKKDFKYCFLSLSSHQGPHTHTIWI